MKKEQKEYRTPYEKRYLNKDGTVTVERFDTAIHYKNKNGYQNINHRIKKRKNTYYNQTNLFTTIFEAEGCEELVTITYQGETLKLGFPHASVRHPFPNSKQTGIIYRDILKEIDLAYQIENGRLKEQIILKSPKNIETTFVFSLETTMKAILNDDQTILLYKGKEPYLKIETPFMIDQTGMTSHNLHYQLNETSDGYQIVLRLDERWLKDKSRTYPVIVDPTITTTTNESLIDTYLSNTAPDQNYGMMDTIYATATETGEILRSLLRIPLPVIGTGDEVIDARLHLVGYPKSYPFPPTYQSAIVSLHRVTKPWKEMTATWNNMAFAYDPLVEDYHQFKFSQLNYDNSFNPMINSMNITALVKRWYAGLENNSLKWKMRIWR